MNFENSDSKINVLCFFSFGWTHNLFASNGLPSLAIYTLINIFFVFFFQLEKIIWSNGKIRLTYLFVTLKLLTYLFWPWPYMSQACNMLFHKHTGIFFSPNLPFIIEPQMLLVCKPFAKRENNWFPSLFQLQFKSMFPLYLLPYTASPVDISRYDITEYSYFHLLPTGKWKMSNVRENCVSYPWAFFCKSTSKVLSNRLTLCLGITRVICISG